MYQTKRPGQCCITEDQLFFVSTREGMSILNSWDSWKSVAEELEMTEHIWKGEEAESLDIDHEGFDDCTNFWFSWAISRSLFNKGLGILKQRYLESLNEEWWLGPVDGY